MAGAGMPVNPARRIARQIRSHAEKFDARPPDASRDVARVDTRAARPNAHFPDSRQDRKYRKLPVCADVLAKPEQPKMVARLCMHAFEWVCSAGAAHNVLEGKGARPAERDQMMRAALFDLEARWDDVVNGEFLEIVAKVCHDQPDLHGCLREGAIQVHFAQHLQRDALRSPQQGVDPHEDQRNGEGDQGAAQTHEPGSHEHEYEHTKEGSARHQSIGPASGCGAEPKITLELRKSQGPGSFPDNRGSRRHRRIATSNTRAARLTDD